MSPNTPKEGIPILQYFRSKFGEAGVQRYNMYLQPNNPLDNAAKPLGLTFLKDRLVVDTMNCHRLMEWCYQTQPLKANKLMELMFKANFSAGKNLALDEELLLVIDEAGLDIVKANEVLKTDASFRDEVINFDKSIKSTRDRNFNGIPFFTISGTKPGGKSVSFSGAQDVDTLVELLGNA